MSRLPPGAHEHLTQLTRLKEALEHGELTPAQKNLAEQLLRKTALTRQRRQYISDMVAAACTDEEIKLEFASPDSLMTILISAFTETETVKKLQEEIWTARQEYESGTVEARRKALVRRQHLLLEATWAAVNNASATHQKPLLERADAISRSIAEIEGLQTERAGRTNTRLTPADERPAPTDGPRLKVVDGQQSEEPDWEEEFADESDD